MKNKHVRAFVAGSAFPVIIWPFIYMGIVPAILKSGADYAFVWPAILIPVIVGLLNVVYVSIKKRLPFKNENHNLWLFGILHGLSLSIYGNFYADIPSDLFLLSGPIEFITIPLAMLAYGLIWRYAIKHMNKFVGI